MQKSVSDSGIIQQSSAVIVFFVRTNLLNNFHEEVFRVSQWSQWLAHSHLALFCQKHIANIKFKSRVGVSIHEAYREKASLSKNQPHHHTLLNNRKQSKHQQLSLVLDRARQRWNIKVRKVCNDNFTARAD